MGSPAGQLLAAESEAVFDQPADYADICKAIADSAAAKSWR